MPFSEYFPDFDGFAVSVNLITVKVYFAGTFRENRSDIQTNGFACHR